MKIIKRMLCLANSRKRSGRCLAGLEFSDDERGEWIRPVSAREHEEVSEYERQYEDGSDPRVLDVIDVPLIEPRPRGYQRENWLLDPEYYWEKVKRASYADLYDCVDPIKRLWVDGYSTSDGLNDKIPLFRTQRVSNSLRLIHVDEIILSVFRQDRTYGNSKRRVQARFIHAGVPYWLWVTDPVYERDYLAEPDGEYEVGECFLTVSLSELYQGACYKLIASIIEEVDHD